MKTFTIEKKINEDTYLNFLDVLINKCWGCQEQEREFLFDGMLKTVWYTVHTYHFNNWQSIKFKEKHKIRMKNDIIIAWKPINYEIMETVWLNLIHNI